MIKQKIAIIAGGDSGEYEISIKSAAVVQKHLDHSRFDSFLVVIRGKNWVYTDDEGVDIQIDKDDFSLDLPEGKLNFDGVFVAIHGTPGEDGKIPAAPPCGGGGRCSGLWRDDGIWQILRKPAE